MKQQLAVCNRRNKTDMQCLQCLHSRVHYPFADVGEDKKCSQWSDCERVPGVIIKVRCVALKKERNNE